jgi:hypothetical protein
MECEACGFDGLEIGDYGEGYNEVEWIELAVVERSPFFVGTPDYYPGDSVRAIKRGTPTRLLACPQCGTVKIEV